MLDNVPWYALQTEHRHLAVCGTTACRYQPSVSPFAGIADYTPESLRALARLVEPEETVYLLADAEPAVPELACGEPLPCLQMVAPGPPPREWPLSSRALPVRLGAADSAEMIALINLVFPGFFRDRTIEMGTYFGIRIEGQLVAMAGERMALPGYREISGVCTHPAHSGRGYAAQLITRLMQEHARAGVTSYLHVAAANARAIGLYQRLGFATRREVCLYPISVKA